MGNSEEETLFTADRQPLPPQVPIEAMAPNTVQVIHIFTCSGVATTKTFSVKVAYDTPQGLRLQQAQQMRLAYQQPVEAHIKFLPAASSQILRPIQIPQHAAP